jgi:hypothetical protein
MEFLRLGQSSSPFRILKSVIPATPCTKVGGLDLQSHWKPLVAISAPSPPLLVAVVTLVVIARSASMIVFLAFVYAFRYRNHESTCPLTGHLQGTYH